MGNVLFFFISKKEWIIELIPMSYASMSRWRVEAILDCISKIEANHADHYMAKNSYDML